MNTGWMPGNITGADLPQGAGLKLQSTKTSSKGNYLRAIFRLGALFIHMSYCIARYLLDALKKGASPELGVVHAHRFAMSVNNLLGIDVSYEGHNNFRQSLIVANHRSYVDVTALLEKISASFLAKEEVASWPVLGAGTRHGGTVFVKRESKESRKRARKEIAGRLANQISVVVFPEGTTYQGPGVLPFKKGLFHLAAEGKFPVVPVAIIHEVPTDAWVGDETFIAHFLRVFSRKKISIHVKFGPALVDEDPEALCETAWYWIDGQCKKCEPSFQRSAQ